MFLGPGISQSMPHKSRHARHHILRCMGQGLYGTSLGQYVQIWNIKWSTNLWAKEAADLAALTYVKCTEGDNVKSTYEGIHSKDMSRVMHSEDQIACFWLKVVSGVHCSAKLDCAAMIPQGIEDG